VRSILDAKGGKKKNVTDETSSGTHSAKPTHSEVKRKGLLLGSFEDRHPRNEKNDQEQRPQLRFSKCDQNEVSEGIYS